MTREEAAVYVWETYEWCMREYENARADKGMMSKTKEAFDVAIAALTANPCDNCIGPALAISHGYKDMRTKTEEAK